MTGGFSQQSRVLTKTMLGVAAKPLTNHRVSRDDVWPLRRSDGTPFHTTTNSKE